MGGNKMRKLFFGTVLLALVIVVPIPTMARVAVNVRISLPPPIVFAAPPALIVLPETYVYVVPDVDADIFFYNGWWWRPWEGRWYRSRHYDSGWVYYQSVPSFYREDTLKLEKRLQGPSVGRSSMGLPTNPPKTTSTELEHLGKEQALGETKYLGCRGFATPKTIAATFPSSPTTISGKTASS